ncbi:HpcH/HpaI aldolase/citrate lyase family protein [Rhodococcus sp. ACS1]|uniref:HpcH/HpaI aldolase family protein n=1 Tax=Rhodococcus sp. ACS1 TaxID=2028570 RepID=UPI00211BE963|nr:aldolase/citrate lyase family protein [Rhodococcus sp. ACS1]
MLDSALTCALLSRSGYEFLVVDLQHSPFDVRRIEAVIGSCVGTTCSPLARVLPGRPDQIGWILDLGAHGVVVPLVNTPDDAKRAIDQCKYPPRGRRSIGAVRNLMFRGADYADVADDDVACIIQIEHVDALANLDSILDVGDIDAIMPGHIDLARSMGYKLQYGPASIPTEVTAAIAEIEQAAKKRSIPVIPVPGSLPEIEVALAKGHRVICCGTDFHTFRAAIERQIQDCRDLAAGLADPS